MRTSMLGVAWLAVAVLGGVVALVAVDASLGPGSTSRVLVLAAVALAAITVVGLGVVLLVALRDAVALARSARDAARATSARVAELRDDLASLRSATGDLGHRLAEVAAATSGTRDDLAALDGQVREVREGIEAVAARLEVVAAGLEQSALDEARAARDLATRLEDVTTVLRSRTGAVGAPEPAAPPSVSGESDG